MKIEDVYTRNAKSCRKETDLAAVASMMWDADCGVVPVVDETNRVIGVVTDRDICMALASRGNVASQVQAGSVMNGEAHSIRPQEDVKSALQAMTEKSVRRLPVVGAKGELLGMFSLSDAVQAVRASKVASAGDPTQADVFRVIEAICKPRSMNKAIRSTAKTPVLARK